jgi:hypothetical protein
MSIVAIVLLWGAGVVLLAGRGLKRAWLAGLAAFLPLCALLFYLEPSFRGPRGRDYLNVALVVAALVWAAAAVVSVIAWFVGARRRTFRQEPKADSTG